MEKRNMNIRKRMEAVGGKIEEAYNLVCWCQDAVKLGG
jgi:hypothetical protein